MVSDTADAFVSTVKKAAGAVKDAVVVTFANGGTYDDFLCGLEDDIYSGAEFMSMMFIQPSFILMAKNIWTS